MTVESWRVAQIVVDRGPDDDSYRGSGYLVAPGLVLTAAHVVAGASAVRVRLDVDQRTEIDVQAERWWADPEAHHGTDLAVIMIPADATAERDVGRVRFGRISDSTAVLTVRAFGFPRFKLRTNSGSKGDSGVFRDLEQVTGHAPVAANRRQGTLAVYLDDPPPAASGQESLSPWEGMSGAAVWGADRIVGVVAEHHPREGAGRLTARRIDRVYEELPESELDRLVGWLELAPSVGRLPDVVPTEPGQLLRSAYLEQVRDITPDALVGRDSELAEWAEFCAGVAPYAWWQAGPWSGKSALASWFVTHPPAGVDIISFFITGHLAGWADSDAFLDAMIEQLSALGPAGGESPPVAGARVGAWLSLLSAAATRAEERARRLVVVVDGLDEDDAGTTPPRGRPSIASVLPRRPPSGARFIVTSRPDPGLPDDVPSGHPLRICVPHHLQVSPVAEDLESRAKLELQGLLAGDQVAIGVVGYIAASGGGLTEGDLSALTGAPPRKLDSVLHGVSGRSLQTRAPSDSRDTGADPAARVYLFAHQTLRVTAEQQLGIELDSYRKGIHDWIRSYASQGWPDGTPSYAIRGYLGLLTTISDGARLSALARDSRRHAFLLRATGSDYAALTEIRTAQRLITEQDMPDLQALVELAVYRDAISIRNQSIPIGLPAMWAWLGRFDHAEALARTITDPGAQAQALTGLATATAQAGDPDRASRLADHAEALARAITGSDDQARALAQLAAASAQAGDPDRASRLAADAEALARAITGSDDQARALAQLAAASAQARDPDRASRLAADAEALARAITSPEAQAWVFVQLATAAAQTGDPDRTSRLAVDAEVLARAITDPVAQARALTQLAAAAAQAGDPDRASRLANDVNARADAITDPEAQAWVLTWLATAAALTGDSDRAEAVARTILNPFAQARAFSELATAAAKAGDLDRGEALACTITDPGLQAWVLTWLAIAAAKAGDPDRAEALARAITSPGDLTEGLTALATAAAQAGDPDRASRLAADAEALARTITSPGDLTEALTALATAAAQAGDPDRASRLAADAEALARAITDPGAQARALTALATAAAQAGDPDRAEALGRTITDPGAQAQALAQLVTAAAQARDPDRASRLTADAEALARAITDPGAQTLALADLATATAQAGDLDHAWALARTITSPNHQVQAFSELATAAAQAGDSDRAAALARTITDPGAQAWVLVQLVTAAAQAGDPDRASRLAADAEALARAITDPGAQAWALARLATAAAQAGDPDRASRLAADAEALARAITDPGAQAWALARLATAAVQAGDPDHAWALARTITSPNHQVQAFSELATAAAQAGDMDRAEALARTITDPGAQARVLVQLVTAAAQAGDLDRASRLAADAETLARAITDPGAQAWALVELATAAAQAGDVDHARHLLALTLSGEPPPIGSWIGTVSRFFPSIIRDAGDVLLSAYKTGA